MTSTIAVPALPRLRSGVEPRLTEDDRLYLLCDGDDGDLLIESDGAWAAAVLALSNGARSVTDIEAALERSGTRTRQGVSLPDTLTALAEAGLLDDAAADGVRLAPEVAERFDRQLAFFREAAPGIDAAQAQARLTEAHVCLIGAGGLGSWTAWALACCGIGRLTVVDGDRVELSNLNRQILYRHADLGRAKADAAAEALRAFLPELVVEAVPRRLEDPGDVTAAIRGADLVVNAADWPPHRIDRWVNDACWAARTPYLSMSQHPPKVRVGPLYVPGRTGCYGCQELEWRDSYAAYDALADAARPFAPASTFGPACGVVGSLVASEAVRLLAGLGAPASLATSLVVDTWSASIEATPVERRADCQTCGAQAGNA